MTSHLACRYRSTFLAMLFGVFGISSFPASAQSSDPPLPPEAINTDQNGMSVTSRRPVITPGEMSIDPDHGGFRFSPDMFDLLDKDSFSYLGNLVSEIQINGYPTSTYQKKTMVHISLEGEADEIVGPSMGSVFGSTSILGTGATITGDITEPIIVRRDGTRYHFTRVSAASSAWVVTKMEMPNGEVRNFTWEFLPRNPGAGIGWGRVISVTNNYGFQIKITYQPGAVYSNRVANIYLINNAYEYCSPTASCSLSMSWPTATFTYTTDSNQYPQSVTLPSGRTTTMSYPANGYSVMAPGSSTYNLMYTREVSLNPCLINTSDVRINALSINGNSWSYVRQIDNGTNYGPTGTDTVTTPQSGVTVYSHTFGCKIPIDGSLNFYYPSSPQLITKKMDPLLRTTTFEYDTLYRISKVTAPDLSSWQYAYDDRGNRTSLTHNAVPGSGLPAQVTELNTYPATCTNTLTCNKPTSVADAKGNVTDYTYSPDNGNILTKTEPAVNGIRPQTRYEYVQRYAWVKDASGAYVHAASPVWVLSAERTCRTTATVGNACAGGAADEIVTAYDYGPDSGPNNLLLRGTAVTADGQTQRTCYGVDRFGNRISETKAAAGLASCS